MASEVGGGRAKNVFWGLGLGALWKAIYGWVKVVPDDWEVHVPFLKKGQIGAEMSSALFGVGYILGPRVGGIMVGGGLLSWLVIIPAIAWWGEGRTTPLYPETVSTIAEMSPSLIWTRYVRYIGAGAVAAGGLITLIKSIPTMIESFRIGARQLSQRPVRGRGREDRAHGEGPAAFLGRRWRGLAGRGDGLRFRRSSTSCRGSSRGCWRPAWS